MAYQDAQLFEEEPALIQCLPELNGLRMAGKLTDLTIELQDNVKLHAHRVVFASRIVSLCESLCEMPKNEQTVLHWPKVSSEVAIPFTDYVYSGQLEVHEVNAAGLIVLSQQLLMPQVEEWAVSFMAARLNSENIASNWNLAQLLKGDQLRNACLQHIKTAFEATVASDLFMQLPSDVVLSLVQADDLQVNSEEGVFRAIGRWVSPLGNVDETRLVHAEAMMREVRWNRIDTEFRYRLFDDEGFWNKNVYCLQLLGRINKWIECPSLRGDIQCPFTQRHRGQLNSSVDSGCPLNEQSRNTLDQIYLIGRAATGEKWCLSRYDADTKTTEHLAETTDPSYTVYVATEDSIFAIGAGPYDGSHSRVDKFHTKERRWSKCAPLSVGRQGHAAVAVPVGRDNVICVCGGLQQNNQYLHTCELYSPQEDRWYALPNLKESRSDSAAVALPDGRVFVIGGSTPVYETKKLISSVETFHLQKPADWPKQKNYWNIWWMNAAPMIAARSKHAAVAFDGCILVVGGSCGNRNYVDSVEVFSLPDNHRPMGQWTVLTNRTFMGQCISLVVWQDRPFAFCSKVDSSNSIQEFFPPASQSVPSRKKFDNWAWVNLTRANELSGIRGAVLLHQL